MYVYTGLGREGRVQSNPVQDVRAPKAPKPLPKALAIDDSVQLADWQDSEAAFDADSTALMKYMVGWAP